MHREVLVLGAGFGGLELASMLSADLGNNVDVLIIDKSDSFVFGYSKLDVMFGRTTLDQVSLSYRNINKPGVEFRQETITNIDPALRAVTTDQNQYTADFLVIALGADYNIAGTPGLAEGGNEFYSVSGALRLAEILPTFTTGHVLVGVCDAPFKCPPAPSEAALLVHDYLVTTGSRKDCEITLTMPFGIPVPPSPDTSRALLSAFTERDIRFVPNYRVSSIDPDRKVAIYDDESERSFDLFLGVPKHQAPDFILTTEGLTENGYIPVNPRTLETRYTNVYAVGDVATIGVPKAGIFAEGAARVVAKTMISQITNTSNNDLYDGRGSCYIEFGEGQVGRVNVDFFSGPKPTGEFEAPSTQLVVDKENFGESRRKRWFS